MTSKEAIQECEEIFRETQEYSNDFTYLLCNKASGWGKIKADLEVLEILKNQFEEVEIEGSTAIWNYQKRIAENVYALKIIKQATGNAIYLYFKTEEEAQKIKEWLKQ